jgi:hypothetical protein
VLEGIVFTTGAVIFAVGSWLGWRWYNGYSIPFLDAFEAQYGNSPDRANKHMITPDVIRT